MRTIGLDIGGANLKAASSDGIARSRAFPLWKHPERLSAELRTMLAELGPADAIAVTMTGELADCFETKTEGVSSILAAVEEAAGGVPIHVWQTGAEFVSPEVAREIPLLVAAANWHALATWIGRIAPAGGALLIDLGSTTTDVIPLLDGVPVPHGLTDVERLQAGELVYSGVRRTPVCAVAHSVPFHGGTCPMAAELFATMLDVYLLLGRIAENSANLETANGRPATRAAARDRLARMLCCDRTEVTDDDLEHAARFLADVQRQRIAGAVDRVVRRSARPGHVLISGEGSFLAEQIAREHPVLRDAQVTALETVFDAETAKAACAAAVARLASERVG